MKNHRRRHWTRSGRRLHETATDRQAQVWGLRPGCCRFVVATPEELPARQQQKRTKSRKCIAERGDDFMLKERLQGKVRVGGSGIGKQSSRCPQTLAKSRSIGAEVSPAENANAGGLSPERSPASTKLLFRIHQSALRTSAGLIANTRDAGR